MDPKESLDLEDRPPKQDNRMINEILIKIGVSQAKCGKIWTKIIGKVLKKSKVDWNKRKSVSKYYPGKRRGPKRQPEFLGETFFPLSGSTNIAMDDESYLGLKDDITPGNGFSRNL